MSERNFIADILKGLAVIFMVQVHIFEQFANEAANQTLFAKVSFILGGPFCAPVFLAVMGYFIQSNKNNLLKNIKRGFILFAIGIILNIGRSLHLLIEIFYEKYNINPLNYILDADILTLAGLSIILLTLLQLIFKNNIWLYIIALVFFGGFSKIVDIDNHSNNYFLAYIIGKFNTSYFPLFPWFSYVLAGYIFKISYNKIKFFMNRNSVIKWSLIITIMGYILFYMKNVFETSQILENYYHHNFLFVFWTISILLMYVSFLKYSIRYLEGTILTDLLSWLGKNVTVFYIIQWLIIGNLATSIFQTQNVLECELWFTGIMTITGILTFYYKKIIYKIRSKYNDNLV